MKRQRGTVSRPTAVAGYVAVVLVMSAGAATGLSGSNTVYSDDIVDTAVKTADLGTNSVSRSKIQDNAVAGTEVLDGSLSGADIRDGGLGRSDLAFAPISDVVQVGNRRTYAGFQFAGNTVSCPNTHPVPLSGGYGVGTGAEAGFALRAIIPVETGFIIYGQNTSQESKEVVAYAVCASDGSSG